MGGAPCASGRGVSDETARRRRPVNAAALAALRVYKTVLSPVFYFFGARCRHEPTCSEYAADAFARHGAWRAFWLTVSRLSRCHPWGSSGYDPAPETTRAAGWRVWRLGDWAWTKRGESDAARRPD